MIETFVVCVVLGFPVIAFIVFAVWRFDKLRGPDCERCHCPKKCHSLSMPSGDIGDCYCCDNCRGYVTLTK